MKAFISLGRWLFAIPFAIFGLFHFLGGDKMTGAIPAYLPAPIFWVYLTGAAMLAASISMMIGKYDKLAAVLLAILLILYIVLITAQGITAEGRDGQDAIGHTLTNLVMAGAALMYAQYAARDNSVVG